jgi:hypothetical protein
MWEEQKSGSRAAEELLEELFCRESGADLKTYWGTVGRFFMASFLLTMKRLINYEHFNFNLGF